MIDDVITTFSLFFVSNFQDAQTECAVAASRVFEVVAGQVQPETIRFVVSTVSPQKLFHELNIDHDDDDDETTVTVVVFRQVGKYQLFPWTGSSRLVLVLELMG